MSEFGSFDALLDDEEIRETIALPRNIPRKNREDIAHVLYREIALGEDYEVKDVGRFIDRFGIFYLLLIALKSSDEWARLKELASASRISALIILRILLTEVFDLLEDFGRFEPAIKDILSSELLPYLERFQAILESTLELWQRRAGGERPTAEAISKKEVSRMPELIGRFEEGRASRRFLDIVSRDVLMARIMGQVSEIEGHLESLEMLTLLYPGRGWDRSMLELHRTYFANLHKYSKIVERNDDLKKILDLIGRIEMEYGARRQSMASYSHSELYSVTTSGDIQHMLPVESVKLQDETLRNLFFANWIEKKLLTYELKGLNLADGPKKRRGPMVAMVDTSGSMHGGPEIVAKSIILALVRRMLKEGRDVKVYLFSSAGQTKDIELTDTKKMASEFLDFLNYTFEGGTDFNTALREGVEALRKKRYMNADILFITDGLSVVNDEHIIMSVEEMKRSHGNRIFTIVVGNDSAGGIDYISDHVFILDKADRWDPEASPANAIRLISAR
ncbi:MAG TPA: VWA domain-containing protein [Methanocella sp.]|uniref:vWA domain-containing protein n=1 Tax=Methanocella sp. TaxID=2052833 RepID=UPI002C105223|nr:VWA domain-containing protein [Methanocella sp.]HTY90729.1 VWA domain-containing protein [Methanocella sp.]